jgi:large subunit ribosomal protein L25
MEQVVLQTTSREPGGKGAARKARREGAVPGVAYGHGKEPRPLLVDAKVLRDILHHHHSGNVLLDLKVDGQAPEGLAAIIKSVQTDPITDALLAVDFQWVSLAEKVHVAVPVATEGAAPGVQEGGILEQILYELQVSCLPGDMPESIVVDISGMQIGDTLHIADIAAPPGVEILTHGDEPLVTVRHPHVAAVSAEPAEGAEEAEEEEEAAE